MVIVETFNYIINGIGRTMLDILNLYIKENSTSDRVEFPRAFIKVSSRVAGVERRYSIGITTTKEYNIIPYNINIICHNGWRYIIEYEDDDKE